MLSHSWEFGLIIATFEFSRVFFNFPSPMTTVCSSFDDSGLLLIEVPAKNVQVMLFYGWGIYGQMVTQWFQWSFFSSRVYVVELNSSPIKSRMMHIRREGAVIPRPSSKWGVCLSHPHILYSSPSSFRHTYKSLIFTPKKSKQFCAIWNNWSLLLQYYFMKNH